MLNHAKMAASVTITMMLVMIGRMMGCLYFFNMQKKKSLCKASFAIIFGFVGIIGSRVMIETITRT